MQQSVPSTPERQESRMLSSPLRVLIIDDSPDDAMLLVRVLQHAGFEPQAQRVDTAKSMLAALDAGPFDVVLSDWSMPDFSAQAAFVLLRERDLDLPFIIVSGTVGEETAVE